MRGAKILMPGGTGHVGQAIRRHLEPLGYRFVVLSRHAGGDSVAWDGRTLGSWTLALDGCDVVINLAGRSVNCRYTAQNLREMMDSRIESTRVIGQAIAQAKRPPTVWLQASTATIYAHRFDGPNDDVTGVIGGVEPGAPRKWLASVEIAKAWEAALDQAPTPHTRKVAMRSSMIMSVEPGSIFDVLATLASRGLAGAAGDGRQYVSWIHEDDFARAILFLLERGDLDGPINVCSPNPVPQREFSSVLRQALGVRFGLPAAKWMLELGAAAMGTETELVLKSRRVVPKRLLDAGFQFRFPDWQDAALDLARQWKNA